MTLEQTPKQVEGLRQSLFAGDRMEQAFAILKMPLTELAPYLEEAINQNPLLERQEPKGGEKTVDEEAEPLNFTEEDFSFVAPFAPLLEEDEELPRWEERIEAPDPLSHHLLVQAEEEFSTEEERMGAIYLIGSLESDGTLVTPLEEIASFSHISLSTLERILPIMKGFDPPGVFSHAVDFDKTEVAAIIPDLIQKGKKVLVSEADIPLIKFRMPKTEKMNSEDKAFVRERLQAGKWLIKNLETRRKTLEKIGEALIFFQKSFFSAEQGPLHPLTYKEVGEKIGLHGSTIARAVDQKWFATNRGTFPLEAFFPEKIENCPLSSEGVKEEMIRLIREEDKSHPLSDEALSKRLCCSRRVITKYRKLLSIPTSRERTS